AAAVGGELVGADGEETVARLSTDTRDLDGGALFVALVGERFDAHDFLEDARQAGARAAIVHDEQAALGADLPAILVDDTLVALQRLAHEIWRDATAAGLRTVALTGSNGKTTVKEMIASVFSQCGPTFATPGNLNNHIGVPLTLCALPAEAEYLVVEMGANAVGDIAELIEIAPGQTRVITSIGAAHLEGFGGLDGVRRGKSEIFDDARADDIAIVPLAERDRLSMGKFPGRVLTVGDAAEADVRLIEFEPRGGRPIARFELQGRQVSFELPIPGRHHALNLGTALAATVAEGLGLSRADIQAALDELVLPGGRWREEEVDTILFIDDAYNANPTSTVASFDAFMQIEDERPRVAVIGEMLELGEAAASQHVDVARRIAKSGRLRAFAAVGPYARAMSEAAEDAVDSHAFEDAEAAGTWLAEHGSQSDGLLVFLKGSRGARLEDVIERTREILAGDGSQ
ncbi:MAG: UDP-N-acetylmuramoyl-tripeptide--D-alanyl-D-alanine ligase, partial [Myxococcota bacterium]